MSNNRGSNHFYQLSNSYKINYIRIENPLLNQIYKISRPKFSEEEYDNELFGRFLMPLRFALYDISTSLKPYCEIINEDKITELRNVIDTINAIYNDQEVYSQLFDLLLKIVSSNRNPILDYLKKNVIKHSSQTHVVVTKREIEESQKSFLKRQTGVQTIEFYSERTFKRTNRSFDFVIFIGNENYFDYSFNSVPRAKVSYYLSYSLYDNKFENNSMFLHLNQASYYSTMYKGLTITNDEIKNINDVDNLNLKGYSEEPIDTTPPTNIDEPKVSSWIFQDIVSKIDKQEHTELIEIVPVELTQGRIILLANKERKHEILTNARRIEKRKLDSITTEDYLLIRNQSETTLIKTIADELFADVNISEYRYLQKKLKKYLKKLVEKYGTAKLCRILQKKGLESINELKINHLLKDDSFKLKNNKEYANFLLILTKGNEKAATKYYEASRKLAAFHIQAGRMISNELRRKIKQLDLAQLYETGSQIVELPEYKGASFTIEMILDFKSEIFSVPLSQEKKVIKYI
ncbi:hypothetical protein [Alkalihalobacillus trypoxylicola]|uniref:Uncharacterized protein n=1 Tax=Alkalihalobacillus trypoxylicola TaxID=519424 RepID=A0A162D1J4_9BACI|nr:hypothetical protein [Alkalihalobacillus trypoxylicola]KYG27725.1 hypothetical protein AZF04_11090 [Alkalihalobacillus trypoxylicola]